MQPCTYTSQVATSQVYPLSGQIQQMTDWQYFSYFFAIDFDISCKLSPEETRLWHFMQIVSRGDNLHEISKSVFWEKWEKYFKMSSAAVCPSMQSLYMPIPIQQMTDWQYFSYFFATDFDISWRRQFAWNVKSVFWEKWEKYFKMSSAATCPSMQSLYMPFGTVFLVVLIFSYFCSKNVCLI